MFERILVATDFSPSAQRALDLVRANFPNARLKLLHVLDSRAMAVPDFTTGGMVPVPPPGDIQRDLGRADEERMQQLALSGEEHEILSGDPVKGILQGAQAWNADLVVVGTHGRRGLEHFFLGSVAEKVVRESLVPVLTVRDRHPNG